MPSLLIVEHTVNKIVYITNKSENESTIFWGENYGSRAHFMWSNSLGVQFQISLHANDIETDRSKKETIAFTIKYKDTMLW